MNILVSLLLLFTFLCTCSTNPPVAGDGGTTEVTNAEVVGFYYTVPPGTKDSIPIACAEVVLHVPDISNKITLTSSDGYFEFDCLDSGDYCLEGNAHDSVGIVQKFRVHYEDTLVAITGILDYVGGVRGQVVVDSTIPDPDSIYKTTIVCIDEIEICLPVDANGMFEDRRIPPYDNYTILIVNDYFPEIKNMFKVCVNPGELTILDDKNFPPYFTHDETAMTNTAYLDMEYRDTVHALDPENDTITFTLDEGGCTTTLIDSIITWVPGSCCIHDPTTITVHAHDNKGGYAVLTWEVHIQKSSPVKF